MTAAGILVEALSRGLPGDRLVVDPDVLATIAHAGDGNLHPLLVTPPGDDEARLAAQAAFEEFLDAAIALGGTVTGEHGVGILKRDGMRRELDLGSLALQSAVRSTLDPLQIFNPGKA